MLNRKSFLFLILTVPALLILCFLCLRYPAYAGEESGEAKTADLVALFHEFRDLLKPEIIEGIPDYTLKAMERQFRELKALQKRLAGLETGGWTVAQKIDYHLVRAEMNGLEFNHRVLRPWSRDPGFYSTVSRFEETMAGAVRIPRRMPLPEDSIKDFQARLQALPKILEQAKVNLTDVPGDLGLLALRMKQRERDMFSELAERLEQHHPELVNDAKQVVAAIDNFRDWLEMNRSRMTAPAGVGIDNYNWYLKNVYLFPYTWDECWAIVQRELERAHTALKLEEHRNRQLPPHKLVTTGEEFKRLHVSAQEYLLDFLKREGIMTVPDFMKVKPPPSFTRPGGFRNFFEECLDRDPLPLIAHDIVGHTPDAKRQARDDRPVRGVGRPFHIAGIRAEALATGIEEMLTHLGLLDERRRSRELAYILVAFRAARAAADLKMNSNELSFEEALRYTAEMTPRGYAKADSFLVWDDLELYIRQPGYGMGYLMGKVQLEKLLADRARQLGESFSFKQFMDEFVAAGVIPISLVRWEMTGLEDEIKKLW